MKKKEIQVYLSKNDFIKGMDILQGIFSDLYCNIDIAYDFLKDITKEEYDAAIIHICKNTKELYPNTNLVALIRDTSETIFLKKIGG